MKDIKNQSEDNGIAQRLLFQSSRDLIEILVMSHFNVDTE